MVLVRFSDTVAAMLKLATVGIVAIFSLSGPQTPSDEIAALKRELEKMRAQQATMKADLDEIKALLEAATGRKFDSSLLNADVAVAGEPAKGSPNAKVMIVEVSDYHCPFCRRHMQQTAPQLETNFIATGKVRYVFIDYPIEQLHPDAFKAHEAANCAGDENKYWEMHAKLFAEPAREVPQLVKQAESLGLDGAAFRKCLEGGKYSTPVRQSVARMQQLGVDSTPTFLLGMTPTGDQPMKVLKIVKGAVPYQQFKAVIEGLQ
jgi:protein-disulfide isomerase